MFCSVLNTLRNFSHSCVDFSWQSSSR